MDLARLVALMHARTSAMLRMFAEILSSGTSSSGNRRECRAVSVTYRNTNWYEALNSSYDMSIPNMGSERTNPAFALLEKTASCMSWTQQ